MVNGVVSDNAVRNAGAQEGGADAAMAEVVAGQQAEMIARYQVGATSAISDNSHSGHVPPGVLPDTTVGSGSVHGGFVPMNKDGTPLTTASGDTSRVGLVPTNKDGTALTTASGSVSRGGIAEGTTPRTPGSGSNETGTTSADPSDNVTEPRPGGSDGQGQGSSQGQQPQSDGDGAGGSVGGAPGPAPENQGDSAGGNSSGQQQDRPKVCTPEDPYGDGTPPPQPPRANMSAADYLQWLQGLANANNKKIESRGP